MAPNDEMDDIAADLERTNKTSAAEGIRTLARISEFRKKWREALGLDSSVSCFAYAPGMLGSDDTRTATSGEIVQQGIWSRGTRWPDAPLDLGGPGRRPPESRQRLARDAGTRFLSQAFATNPSVVFPKNEAGLTVAREFDNGLGSAIGASAMQGDVGQRE